MERDTSVNRGSSNARSRLTEEQARWILAQRGKMSAVRIGMMYGIAAETIRRLWRGETWLHLHAQSSPEVPVHAYEPSEGEIQSSMERFKELVGKETAGDDMVAELKGDGDEQAGK